MKPSGLLQRRQVELNTYLKANTETVRQLMMDTLCTAANRSLGLGYDRLMKLMDAWDEDYEEASAAISGGAEADVAQAHLDHRLQEISREPIIPFDERYPWIKGNSYEGRKRT